MVHSIYRWGHSGKSDRAADGCALPSSSEGLRLSPSPVEATPRDSCSHPMLPFYHFLVFSPSFFWPSLFVSEWLYSLYFYIQWLSGITPRSWADSWWKYSIYFLTLCFSSGFQIVVHTQWDYYRLLQEPALLAFISTYKGTFSSSEWLPCVRASSLYFVHRTPTL